MSDQNRPRISVIIPTRHRNDLLALCLDRLAPGVQALPPEQYEVIVTDDGADSTAEAMVRQDYPWARWTAGPRQGPAANRNHGASLAQGEWLVFTDDDCLPGAGWLAGYLGAIRPDALMYEGRTTCEAGIISPVYEAPLNLEGGLLWSCNLMFHAGLFWEMEGFDSAYSFAMEDIDMRERLRARKEAVVFAPEAVVDHPPRRQRSGIYSGKHTEAYVRHWYKMGHQDSYLISYLKHIKHRLYVIGKFPVSQDYCMALLSLFVETCFVFPRLTGWERTYRALYAAGPSTVPASAHTPLAANDQ